MISFLFSIDVKKQALSGLFFFYPDLSLFLCNRFGKAHDQTAWTKETLYLWDMCCLSYCFDRYFASWRILVNRTLRIERNNNV